jgi:cytochrome c5
MKQVFPRIAAAAIAGLSAGVIAALNIPAAAQGLPDGKGKDLVGRICVSCHDLAPITTSGGFTRRDWEQVVQSMIDMGADITPDEVPQIVSYLAASFPPKGKQ